MLNLIKNGYKGIIYSLILVLCMSGMFKFFGVSLRANFVWIVGLLVISAVLYIFVFAKKNAYIKSTIGVLRSGSDVKFDVFRIIAFNLVIINHIISMDLEKFVGIPKDIYSLIYSFCEVANPLYIMLSGALLLGYREESLYDFYTKRVTKVALPMIVYYFFAMLLCGQPLNLDNLKVGFTALYNGRTIYTPQYWLMYTLLELYIVVPFFRQMIKNLPYKMLTNIVIITLVYSGILIYLPVRIGVIPAFADYLGVFIIGYWLKLDETRKYDRLIWIGSVISAIVLLILYFTRVENYLYYIINYAPVCVIMGMGIMSLFYAKKNYSSKNNYVIAFLSKYSFGVMLIHSVITLYVRNELHIDCSSYGMIGGFILYYLLSVVFCLIMAYLIDNTAVFIVKYIIDALFTSIKKIIPMKEK